MIDHISLPVRDHAASKTFYLAALAPLGIGVIMEVAREKSGGSTHTGFGAKGKPYFWITEGVPVSNLHLAFAAENRAQVEAFYTAALEAGARDNGPPGVRAHYHPQYYGAFVIDPNGVNLEAVCHRPV